MRRDDLRFLEDLLDDDPVDPLTIPQVKQHVSMHRPNDGLGLRWLASSEGPAPARYSFLPRRFPKHRLKRPAA